MRVAVGLLSLFVVILSIALISVLQTSSHLSNVASRQAAALATTQLQLAKTLSELSTVQSAVVTSKDDINSNKSTIAVLINEILRLREVLADSGIDPGPAPHNLPASPQASTASTR